jgi:transcriptional regulator with XRE-family HTH domain
VAGHSPTVRRRALGIELRRLREQAGLTIEQVARRLEVSDSKISRIETAQVSATPRDVRDILVLYEVPDDRRDGLIQLAREARQKGWWDRYEDPVASHLAGLEAEASSLHFYQGLVVPGLLQTAAYTKAMITALRPDLDQKGIEQRVELRIARQAVFDLDSPPELWAIIDEAVLRRPVGGPGVIREQLEHLIEATAHPRITIQVLPFTAGEHSGMDGPFYIIELAESAHPDVVFLDAATREIFLEDTDEVRRYTMLFDHLRAAALRPSDSKAFVASVAKSFC